MNFDDERYFSKLSVDFEVSIPALYLVYLVFCCQVVVKPRGQGLRMSVSM